MGALNTLLNTDWQSPTGLGSQRKLPLGAGTSCMKSVRRLSVPTENTHLNMASTIRKLTRAHLISVNELIENKIKVAPCQLFRPAPSHILSRPPPFTISKQLPHFWPSYPHVTPSKSKKGSLSFYVSFYQGENPFPEVSEQNYLSSIMLTRIKSCAHGPSARDAGKTVLTISSSQRGDEHWCQRSSMGRTTITLLLNISHFSLKKKNIIKY